MRIGIEPNRHSGTVIRLKFPVALLPGKGVFQQGNFHHGATAEDEQKDGQEND
jgi:hypothetical protein